MSKQKTTQELALAAAGKEIRKIMDKYALAGVAQIYTPSGRPDGNAVTEMVVVLDPHWSLAKIEANGGFKLDVPAIPEMALTPDFQQKAKDTVNMLANLRIRVNNILGTLIEADRMARLVFGVAGPAPKNGSHNKPDAI